MSGSRRDSRIVSAISCDGQERLGMLYLLTLHRGHAGVSGGHRAAFSLRFSNASFGHIFLAGTGTR
jgi:hypothetical protein